MTESVESVESVESLSCPVCTDKYTSVVRTKITCNFCAYHSCRGCVQKYLLCQATEAHCMNCRTGWSREMCDANLTKSFRTGPWREHIKTMLVAREKAVLPNYQRYATALNHMATYRAKLTNISSVILPLTTEMSKCQTLLYRCRNEYSADGVTKETKNELREKYYLTVDTYTSINKKLLSLEFDRASTHARFVKEENIYYNRSEAEERKEFIMKCVKEDCRGFLSSSYKCELCSCYVCKDCMIIKKEKSDTTHVCNNSDKESVALIRKETKPCPKCGIRISKIDGCDQMWCTAVDCGTAFSWNSGKVISGTIHNPHYYDWVRRNNNGVVPRNPNEVVCGGLVDYRHLSRLLYNVLKLPHADVQLIFDIHRCISDFQHVRVPSHPQQRDVEMFKEVHCDYLLNKCTEATWKQSIFLKENKFMKKQQIGQVLQTFVVAGTELMNSLYNKLNETSPDVSSSKHIKRVYRCIDEFNNLRTYINSSLEDVGVQMMCAVPQISVEYWGYVQAKVLPKKVKE